MRTALFVAVTVAALACGDATERPAATGESSTGTVAVDPCARVTVTAEQFGDRWPLTVDRGEVWCVDCLAALFRDPETNTLYGLNGIAMSRGAEEIRPIWRDNPEIPGTKIDIGVLIDLALERCR